MCVFIVLLLFKNSLHRVDDICIVTIGIRKSDDYANDRARRID